LSAQLAVEAETPVPLSDAVRWKIVLYIGALLVLLGFGSPMGGLIGLPITFFLKNKLHLKAHELATFSLISHIPVYLAFVFGFARDRFSPLKMGDRGFLVVFGAVCSALYVAFSFLPPTWGVLLAASLALITAFLFTSSALRGLTSTIAQQHVMSGQISAAWNIFESLPAIAALLAGGFLSDLVEGQNAVQGARILFLVGAVIMGGVALFGLWRPASVFDNLHSERLTSGHPLDDLKRLVRHWPIYPALLIWLMWNFAPGGATPLQFYLQNTLHGADAQWGEWNAIFAAAFIPTFLLYGLLCRRFRLRTLLWWSTLVAVPQFIPLLFVHSMAGAMIAAIPMGLMGGACSAAYFDLIIRSCPHGLQGTLVMAASGLFSADVRFGDLLGTTLYERFGGFTVCVIAITAVYALILPVLLLVPRRLTDTADGEAPASA
jgi:hypothetical protein